MIKARGGLWRVSMLGVVLGAGCVGEPTSAPGPASTEGATSAPLPAAGGLVSHTATVHASVTLGTEHVLQFVEFKPGVTGVVEVGRAIDDQPALTSELHGLSWLDQYRHFAGDAAAVPSSMIDAQARAAAPVSAQAPASPPAQAGTVSGGAGPHFYNAAEQTWFLNTFCNGAQNCVQAWDWTTMYSHWQISSGSAIAMVGSEGTTNATFTAYWDDCSWNLFEGTVCFYLEFWQAVVVPGHWVSMNLSGGSNYIEWTLTGAGGGTQVSTAAHY
jgi:hypothetical protein